MRTRSGGQYVATTGPISLERATDPQVRESHESFRLSPSTNTEPGGTVHVGGRTTENGVEVSVDDACGGIPDDDLARVFDVAWRGTAAREPVTGASGGGLGLAIVKGIVEAHRGRVDVENVDLGCRFSVSLPTPAA